MARAKNTSRSEARRRTRETQRAELAAMEASAEPLEEAADAPMAKPQRQPLFKMPDIRGDLRALPSMFRTKPLLWAPLALLVAGLVMVLALSSVPAEVAGIIQLYIQFFFIPPALFTFFIAGFVAPRGSYLVGLLYGLIGGVMWAVVILVSNASLSATGTEPTTTTTPQEPLLVVANMLLIGALYGTLAAAFAAWYRDFLRGMQERGKQRRAEQEAKDRAKRREERLESRRAAKQRPT